MLRRLCLKDLNSFFLCHIILIECCLVQIRLKKTRPDQAAGQFFPFVSFILISHLSIRTFCALRMTADLVGKLYKLRPWCCWWCIWLLITKTNEAQVRNHILNRLILPQRTLVICLFEYPFNRRASFQVWLGCLTFWLISARHSIKLFAYLVGMPVLRVLKVNSRARNIHLAESRWDVFFFFSNSYYLLAALAPRPLSLFQISWGFWIVWYFEFGLWDICLTVYWLSLLLLLDCHWLLKTMLFI